MEPKPEDIAPDLPALASFILEHFWNLGRTRSSGMGLEPITWGEMRNYRKEMGVKLDCWEKQLILDVDECLRRNYHLTHKSGNTTTEIKGQKMLNDGKPKHLPPHIAAYLASQKAKAEAAAAAAKKLDA